MTGGGLGLSVGQYGLSVDNVVGVKISTYQFGKYWLTLVIRLRLLWLTELLWTQMLMRTLTCFGVFEVEDPTLESWRSMRSNFIVNKDTYMLAVSNPPFKVIGIVSHYLQLSALTIPYTKMADMVTEFRSWRTTQRPEEFANVFYKRAVNGTVSFFFNHHVASH